MNLDDLINEGKTFKMKYREPYETLVNGIRCIHSEEYYFDDTIALSGWIEKTRRYIGIHFNDDQSYDDFCTYGNMKPTDGSIARMIGILISLRDVDGICPKKQDSPATSLQITQTQSQTQNLEFVMDHLEEEFTAAQIKQIEDIIESNLPKSTKRSNLIDLFRDFGVSVGANLLTSLLIK